MHLMWLFIIFSVGEIARATDSTSNPSEFYDPKDDAHHLVLWHGLFTKLNTLLLETDKINQNLLDLNKRFDDLSKRQEEQENSMKKLMDLANLNAKHIGESCLESQISPEDLNNTLSKLMHSIESIGKAENANNLDNLKSQIDQTSNNKPNETWTTILRRQDGSVDFYRNWTDYKNGFGNPPNGEFFIGLEKLHQMTTQGKPQELMIVLKDWKNETRTANYDLFQIGGESEKYVLNKLGQYSGNAEDSLEYQKNMPFATLDRDNGNNCAKQWKGAWWFDNCYNSHLFGPYRKEQEALTKGVGWMKWKGHDYSLQFAEMKIRPKLL